MFDAQILKELKKTQAGKPMSADALAAFVNDIFTHWDRFVQQAEELDEDVMDDFIDEVLFDLYGDDLDASADAAELLDILEPWLFERV